MNHPRVENNTLFHFEPIYLLDEEAMPIFVPIVKASYQITQSSYLELIKKQVEVKLEGEYLADPEISSYKYEPEITFIKPATDIVMIGHAHAQKPETTELQVGISVGPVKKIVSVIGDRYLVKNSGTTKISHPKPFEKMPLVYEKAFGGWDRRDENSENYRFEPKNPVGTAYRDLSLDTDDKLKLPNIEDPKYPYKAYGDTPPPAGFGFISPHWQPRASFSGTYDKLWDKQRKPLLPEDFDRRFFNAASPGLIAPDYLKGDERVVIINASPEGRVEFNLPGVPAPQCEVELRGGEKVTLQTQLDTVIINMDERLVFLLWRTHMIVRNGPHDIVAIKVGSESDFTVTEPI